MDGGRNISVFNNISYNNGNGLSLGCENGGNAEARNIDIFNNLIYSNDNHGMVFGANSGNVKMSTVRNNTFIKNGTYQNWTSEISIQKTDSCFIFQNVLLPLTNFHYAASIFGYLTTNLLFDNNLAYRFSGDQSDIIYPGNPAQFMATNTLVQDPMLISSNVASLDARLQSSSPAVNAGNSLYGAVSTTDLSEEFRIVNGKIDLGAYERQDGGCPEILAIDNTNIILGKMIASQKIVLKNQISTQFELSLYAPIIEIIGQCHFTEPVQVSPIGCP